MNYYRRYFVVYFAYFLFYLYVYLSKKISLDYSPVVLLTKADELVRVPGAPLDPNDTYMRDMYDNIQLRKVIGKVSDVTGVHADSIIPICSKSSEAVTGGYAESLALYALLRGIVEGKRFYEEEKLKAAAANPLPPQSQ
jgi:hypothetical protein